MKNAALNLLFAVIGVMLLPVLAAMAFYEFGKLVRKSFNESEGGKK